MKNILGLNNILDYVWLIPIAISIHELEEWNILKWYKKYYSNIPESTNTSIRIHIFTFCAVSFLLTTIAYILNNNFVFSVIVVFQSAFILFNVTQHIIWTAQFKAYSLGLVTGILSLVVVFYLDYIFLVNQMIHPLFFILVASIVVPIIKTLKVKGEMTSEIRKVHNFFITVEKKLRGK